MLYQLIAAAQKTGAVCAFIDAKHTADIAHMKAVGVEVADLLVSQPDDAITGFEIAAKLAATGAVELIALSCYRAPATAVEMLLDIAANHKTTIVFG